MNAVVVQLPVTRRGRRSANAQAIYDTQLKEFAEQILQINSRLDFPVSARGWCYILEEYGLGKGDFDTASKRINECRKTGLLPVEIVADDQTRSTNNREGIIDDQSPAEFAESLKRSYIDEAYENAYDFADRYNPFSFWEGKDVYIEMVTEKVDLKNLFQKICRDYFIPITNFKGWTDLNSRVALMRRFAEHESKGRQCVMLYCGDHDPGGLCISENIKNNLNDMSKAAGWSPENLIIDRFGLNYDFIMETGLSWVNNLETSSGGRLDDPRHNDHRQPYVQNYINKFGVRKVEANALVTRPEAGRQLCREAINKYLTHDSINNYWGAKRKAIAEVRAELAHLLGV